MSSSIILRSLHHLPPTRRLPIVPTYRLLSQGRSSPHSSFSTACMAPHFLHRDYFVLAPAKKRHRYFPVTTSNIIIFSFIRSRRIGSSSDGASSLTKNKNKRTTKFIPIKAAINLTPKSRQYLKLLIANSPKARTKGIMLNYEQGSDGSPRMMFTFKFLADDYVLSSMDEP